MYIKFKTHPSGRKSDDTRRIESQGRTSKLTENKEEGTVRDGSEKTAEFLSVPASSQKKKILSFHPPANTFSSMGLWIAALYRA